MRCSTDQKKKHLQQCGQHAKEIDYGGWPAPRNHMTMKQGYEVWIFSSSFSRALFFRSLIIVCIFLKLFFLFLFRVQAKMNEHHHNNLQKGQYQSLPLNIYENLD